jgi:hypothetical protein
MITRSSDSSYTDFNIQMDADGAHLQSRVYKNSENKSHSENTNTKRQSCRTFPKNRTH